jgi:hypothetical protein
VRFGFNKRNSASIAFIRLLFLIVTGSSCNTDEKLIPEFLTLNFQLVKVLDLRHLHFWRPIKLAQFESLGTQAQCTNAQCALASADWIVDKNNSFGQAGLVVDQRFEHVLSEASSEHMSLIKADQLKKHL